jgi:hypothetical protein
MSNLEKMENKIRKVLKFVYLFLLPSYVFVQIFIQYQRLYFPNKKTKFALSTLYSAYQFNDKLPIHPLAQKHQVWLSFLFLKTIKF